MLDAKYIIEGITIGEEKLLNENGIDWCPDEDYETNRNAVLFSVFQYNKATELLGREGKKVSLSVDSSPSIDLDAHCKKCNCR